MMELGQSVNVIGKLMKVSPSGYHVEKQERKILKYGIVGVSRKYETVFFNEVKVGIVVGKRSVVGTREHYRVLNPFTGEHVVETKTTRQSVYVVACDLRGLILVPEDCLQKAVEYKCECELDFEFEDDDDLFDDDFEELMDAEDIA